jgi:hypothetical protein
VAKKIIGPTGDQKISEIAAFAEIYGKEGLKQECLDGIIVNLILRKIGDGIINHYNANTLALNF